MCMVWKKNCWCNFKIVNKYCIFASSSKRSQPLHDDYFVSVVHVGYVYFFFFFYSPQNSDTDYRVFNARTWSFCIRMHTEGRVGARCTLSSKVLRGIGCTEFWLLINRPRSAHKAWRDTVAHPCGDHARSCLTTAFESECSRCAPLTPQLEIKENSRNKVCFVWQT